MSSSSPTPVQYNGLNPADYKPGTVAPCEVCGRNCFRSPNSKEGFRCKDHTFAAMKLAELEEQPEPKPKKHKAKKEKSLTIKIQEMEKYDWNPSMRLLLLVIHLGTRRAKDNYDDTWAPTGWTAEEMVGWCDMAQWRLAQRVGLTEDHVGRMLKQLEDDGFILVEGWTDPDTGKLHCRYQVVTETVDANQRPSHTRRTSRGKRTSKPRKGNKGSFSTANQPGTSELRKKIREEDGE